MWNGGRVRVHAEGMEIGKWTNERRIMEEGV